MLDVCQHVQQSTGSDASLSELYTFPAWTLEQQAAMWAQIRQRRKNSDMRDLLQPGKYLDPYNSSKDILQNEWLATVLSEVSHQLTQARPWHPYVF